MSKLLRSEEGNRKYRKYLETGVLEQGCPLCTKLASQTFTYWKIIPNDFPYDLIAKEHDMIVPLHHVREEELTIDELREYAEIKENQLRKYDYIVEPIEGTKSIPKHHHLHLIVGKKI